MLLCFSHPRCVSEPGTKDTLHSGTIQSNILIESRARSEEDAAFEKMLDPIEGSPATGESVAGSINLFVDDLFGTCGTEIEQRVLARLRKDFQVGSENWNDVFSQDKEFVGRRILNQDRALRLVKKRLLRNWRRSQQNETRKKITTVPLQCIQGKEACWVR